jgi:hypothetical protein
MSCGPRPEPPARGTGTRCGRATRPDDPARSVLVDHMLRAEGVGPAVVDSVRQQQHGRGESIPADVRALPDGIWVVLSQDRRHGSSAGGAALVVPPVCAHRDDDAVRRRSRLIERSGEVIRVTGGFPQAMLSRPGVLSTRAQRQRRPPACRARPGRRMATIRNPSAAARRSMRAPSAGSSSGGSRKAFGPQARATSRSSHGVRTTRSP